MNLAFLESEVKPRKVYEFYDERKKIFNYKNFLSKKCEIIKKKVYLCELKYETYGLVENNS